jgi:riboflavin biosynthesis pyrimidine reductase
MSWIAMTRKLMVEDILFLAAARFGEESDINFQKKAIENPTGPFQFRLVHFKHIEELIMFYLSYCH